MKKFLLGFIFFFSHLAIAEINETNDLDYIKAKYLTLLEKYKPGQVMVVFGINNTILYYEDAPLQLSDDSYKPLMKKIFSQLKSENSSYLNEVILTNYKTALVDPKIPEFIKEIMSNHTPVIAVSSSLTGNLNQIPRLEMWLADYLKKYNIDFAPSFSGNKDFTFRNLKEYKGTYPSYYNGLLSTNSKYSKAQVLANFLLQIKFIPKVIIVVDQDLNAIKATEQQLKSYNKNIEFVGFHYTALANHSFEKPNDQEFINFWYALIDKVNKAKRNVKPVSLKRDPYAQ